MHSGKAMSVDGDDTADGAKVVQWEYEAGKAHQQWRLVQKDNEHFALQTATAASSCPSTARTPPTARHWSSSPAAMGPTSSSASANTPASAPGPAACRPC
ncbi:RICIN domain-containing protein [Streptomyces sp. NPDC094143]|uniref:RICIN domain-containing protein n=1 Tax=Streptomyces sp. NPDC094143 TaxID=3155310 RepID=UPI003326B417